MLALVELRRATIAAEGDADDDAKHARQLALERARVIVATSSAPGSAYIVDELNELLDPYTISPPGPDDPWAYEYAIDILSAAQAADNLIRAWQEDPNSLLSELEDNARMREQASTADHRAVARGAAAEVEVISVAAG
ncbi:hypothetical protein ABID92_000412 [Frigoribacterium sp. PvP120]|uniref:hypothetical protein n=1 Tax=Frigoribacterium sp. PvP120 TaxID=3156441 RepID=UPI001B776E37|nr:hypothetical protein [Frigoribacterium sp. PvP121]